jgi:hypothetical protein
MFLHSCSIGYWLPEGGLRPKNYNKTSFYKYRKNFKFNSLSSLDTTAIYVSVGFFDHNDEFIRYEQYYSEDSEQGGIKFDNTGKCSIISFKPEEQTSFDSRTGTMGFYKFKDFDKLKVYTYTATTGGHRFIEREFIIKGDSLIMKDHFTGKDYEVHLKSKLLKNRNYLPFDW